MKTKLEPMLSVNIEGRAGLVPRAKYVAAKTKQLVEFGYSGLTELAVDQQIDAILAGEKLDVIGMFMQGEVIVK